MLPDHLKEQPSAAAVDAFDADALKGGTLAYGELTLEIAAAKIASVCVKPPLCSTALAKGCWSPTAKA